MNNRVTSWWPRGLRHELSSPDPTMGSWVRIPLRHGCLCVFCVRIISELKLLIKSLIWIAWNWQNGLSSPTPNYIYMNKKTTSSAPALRSWVRIPLRHGCLFVCSVPNYIYMNNNNKKEATSSNGRTEHPTKLTIASLRPRFEADGTAHNVHRQRLEGSWTATSPAPSAVEWEQFARVPQVRKTMCPWDRN
jgi:hypothetical protein